MEVDSMFGLDNKKRRTHASDKEDMGRILNESTPFAVREAYRALCTNTLYLPIPDKCRKLAITSPYPGEGKTFITINLAITLASSSSERKVLIIDADMRTSRVMRLLGSNKYAASSGLSEYLAGIDKEPNIVATEHENLDVIPSGAEAKNPAGLLNSPKMRELITWAEENYDYVIFDTPPINVVSDALLLNDYINGYFIATRADYSDVNGVAQALDSLKQVDAAVFGAVLSSLEVKKRSKYQHNYTKYTYSTYDYSSKNKEKEEQN